MKIYLLLSFLLLASSAGGQPNEHNADGRAITEGPATIDPVALLPKILAAPASVAFDGESLLEMASWFEKQHNLKMVFDRSALDELRIPLGEPVYDQLDNEPVYLLLNRLSMLDLAWYYDDGLIRVTTQEEAETLQRTVPYTLGDLLDEGFQRDAIYDSIISTIDAETWAENGGGEAELQWLGDVLFVRQTDETQRRVAGFFAALREYGRQTFILDPPKHIKLRDQLNQPVTIQLNQTPLVVAIEKLATVAEIDIRLDKNGIEELGIRAREPITVDLDQRSLRTVIEVAFGDLDLTWMLRDGVLWITPYQVAETEIKTAVYNVSDLARDASEGDALANAIFSQMMPGSWAENGGGESEITFAKAGLITVSQTEAGHEQLLSLLERYRKALSQSKPRKEKGSDPDEVLTHYYRLPEQVAVGLHRVLKDLVAADSWKSEQQTEAVATILIVPSDAEYQTKQKGEARVIPQSTLIIKQTRSAHEEIAELIEKIRRGDVPAKESSGGLGGGGSGSFGGGFF